MALQAFKIESKNPSLIVAKNAEGEVVNVSINKHARTFLALERNPVGADVQINVEKAQPSGRLMCIDWTKHDQNRAKALSIEAAALTSELKIKQALRTMELMEQEAD